MGFVDIHNTDKKYKVVMADSAWQFKSKNTGGSMTSGAAKHYDVMDLEAMKALPINDLAADNCLLIMWWVSSMPQEALDLAKAWGFKVKVMNGFVWEKQTVKGNQFFGMGHYTRANSESALIATRGKTGEIIKSRSVRQVHRAKVGVHSQKPDLFHDLAEELVGEPGIELFARRAKDGWDYWGNEV